MDLRSSVARLDATSDKLKELFHAAAHAPFSDVEAIWAEWSQIAGIQLEYQLSARQLLNQTRRQRTGPMQRFKAWQRGTDLDSQDRDGLQRRIASRIALVVTSSTDNTGAAKDRDVEVRLQALMQWLAAEELQEDPRYGWSNGSKRAEMVVDEFDRGQVSELSFTSSHRTVRRTSVIEAELTPSPGRRRTIDRIWCTYDPLKELADAVVDGGSLNEVKQAFDKVVDALVAGGEYDADQHWDQLRTGTPQHATVAEAVRRVELRPEDRDARADLLRATLEMVTVVPLEAMNPDEFLFHESDTAEFVTALGGDESQVPPTRGNFIRCLVKLRERALPAEAFEGTAVERPGAFLPTLVKSAVRGEPAPPGGPAAEPVAEPAPRGGKRKLAIGGVAAAVIAATAAGVMVVQQDGPQNAQPVRPPGSSPSVTPSPEPTKPGPDDKDEPRPQGPVTPPVPRSDLEALKNAQNASLIKLGKIVLPKDPNVTRDEAADAVAREVARENGRPADAPELAEDIKDLFDAPTPAKAAAFIGDDSASGSLQASNGPFNEYLTATIGTSTPAIAALHVQIADPKPGARSGARSRTKVVDLVNVGDWALDNAQLGNRSLTQASDDLEDLAATVAQHEERKDWTAKDRNEIVRSTADVLNDFSAGISTDRDKDLDFDLW
jgi:hypothetical protein